MSRAAAYAFWRLSRISLSRTARSTYGLTLSAALETLSFVLGMLRTSFRWLAGRVYPCTRSGHGRAAGRRHLAARRRHLPAAEALPAGALSQRLRRARRGRRTVRARAP